MSIHIHGEEHDLTDEEAVEMAVYILEGRVQWKLMHHSGRYEWLINRRMAATPVGYPASPGYPASVGWSGPGWSAIYACEGKRNALMYAREVIEEEEEVVSRRASQRNNEGVAAVDRR